MHERGIFKVIGMKKLKARIVNIEKHQNRAAYIKQGVQGSEQYKYDGYLGGMVQMLLVESIWVHLLM